jgi:hypothetical protein
MKDCQKYLDCQGCLYREIFEMSGMFIFLNSRIVRDDGIVRNVRNGILVMNTRIFMNYRIVRKIWSAGIVNCQECRYYYRCLEHQKY